MTWTAPTVVEPEFLLDGPERTLLEGFLQSHRAFLRHRCAGLDAEQLCLRAVPPSNLSLLGLVRHMAKVERRWFRELIPGVELEPMYDPDKGVDADFEDLDPARAEADYQRLLDEIAQADKALATYSYDQTLESRMGRMTVRAVVIHMIEEYAQHNGHADLLRECIDGSTGT